MAARQLLAVAMSTYASAQVANLCFEEYECVYKSPNQAFRSYYDLRPLCMNSRFYSAFDPVKNSTFKFQVCGTAPADCVPYGYSVEYQRGSVVQFFGDMPPAGEMCTNKAGQTVPCTQDCEILGVGPPIISLIDPNNPSIGVNVTHQSISSLNGDGFQCDFDPLQGGPKQRTVTIQIQCNAAQTLSPLITWAGEVANCEYLIVMQSSHGCGCQPFCWNRNCGLDGCGGNCGPAHHGGDCPDPLYCSNAGQCCRPDCRGRQCGDDGCGGSCGTCQSGYNCTRYHTCASPNVPGMTALPSMLPSAMIYTTTPGDKFAAYVGGVVATVVCALVTMWVIRARSAA